MSLIPGWVKLAILAGLLAVLTTAYFGWRGQQREIGRAEVRAEVAVRDKERADAALAAAHEYRRIEQRRVSLAAEAERKKNATVQSLDRQLAAALSQLRDRPERPAAGGHVPGDPATGAACTGAQLYRPDAEFLAREAARAQRILAERDYCHERHDALMSP